LLINWRGGVPPGYRTPAGTTTRPPKVVSVQPPALSRELSAQRRAALALKPQRTHQVLRLTGEEQNQHSASATVTSPSEGSTQITERMELVELTGSSVGLPPPPTPPPHSGAHASPYGFLAALQQRRDSPLVSESCRPVALRTMHEYFSTLNGPPASARPPQSAGPLVRAPGRSIERH